MMHPGNLSERDINYRLGHQPQLQKMVQDIKKNDGSLLDKLKSRFTSKSTPKPPARDYHGLSGSDVEEQWSDAEFDTYEDLEDSDDNYEPPPTTSHKGFAPTPAATFHRGEYVDSCRDRPDQTPRKPFRPVKSAKPLPPAPSHMSDEEDYINPEVGNDDNYIDPTENSPSNPLIHQQHPNRAVLNFVSKPAPLSPPSPDVYEVPDHEESSSLDNRMPPLPPKPRPLPLIRSPRLDIRQPPLPVPEPLDAEVCEPNDRSRVPDRPRPFAPKPSRDLPPKPAFRAKTELMDRDDGPLLPSRNDPSPKLPAKQITTDFKRPKIPIPHFLSLNRPADKGSSLSTENAGSTDTEKEEDLYRKSWYAGDCDRKTAEDALMRSNKDGSFLVRQSSGQDVQQPYTLVVLYNDRVYNIPVRFIPATMQYALGREKKGEELFSSVSHMIDSHQRNPLVLIDTQSNNKDATKLLYAVRP